MKRVWLSLPAFALLILGLALVPVGAAAQEDRTPPVLANFSFTPMTVDVSGADAEVTVTFSATDGLSGYAHGIGLFISPSGSQYRQAWFYPDTRISGDAHNGEYQATIIFPRYGEGGTWLLRNLNLCDEVGNCISYSTADLAVGGFPTELAVSGGQDLVPPLLEQLSVAPPSIDVSGSDAEVTVTFRATDELSGYAYGIGLFISPSGSQYRQAWFYPDTRISGDAHNGEYQATIIFPRYGEGGTWLLRNLNLCDEIGNCISYSTADLAVRGFPTEVLVESETADLVPPFLVKLSFAPTSIDVSGGDAEVTVTFSATDELSGYAYGVGLFSSPSGSQYRQAWFYPESRISGDARNGEYQATIIFPRYGEGGTWLLRNLNLGDGVGNGISYSTADLAVRGFPTELHVNVNAPPVAEAGPSRIAIVGELLTFDGSASSDPDGSIASCVWAFGDGTSAADSTPTHSYSAAGIFTVTLTVTDGDGATAIDTATVTVLGPAGAVQSLSALVAGYNLKQGVAGSLNGKLQGVVAAFGAANASQRRDAANKLAAFINAVEAQRGKALTNAQADALVALAGRILTVLG